MPVPSRSAIAALDHGRPTLSELRRLQRKYNAEKKRLRTPCQPFRRQPLAGR
jgi:hypothetical protein